MSDQEGVPRYTLCIKTGAGAMWGHDPSAVLFDGSELIAGAEEERFSRVKHADNTFPEASIRACLDRAGIGIDDIDTLALTADPTLTRRRLPEMIRHELLGGDGVLRTIYGLAGRIETMARVRFGQRRLAQNRVKSMTDADASFRVVAHPHHRCHAASAFYPTDFTDGMVLTADGRGEYDATVVWRGSREGVERIRTYEYPNSLGNFFAVVTLFLGYRPNNGEGKVMGLAPYGEENREIEQALRDLVLTGVEYDTTGLTRGPYNVGVQRLEAALGRDRHDPEDPFTQWQKDLAHAAQELIEETVVDIVEYYCDVLGTENVCLAGGVALNCKLNKRVRESPAVESLFVQPVAHDGGLAIGAGMLESTPDATPTWSGNEVYLGPRYDRGSIESFLRENKLAFETPDELERIIAGELADGRLVGWFQGRMEMGPRALGNRSILADPRTVASRNRVNRYVKHREEWRPFAPSILWSTADEYLDDPASAPYMIQTFGVSPDAREEIEAALHPGDGTTRPQTVSPEANPRYHRLIEAFYDTTGIPILLNTSLNDHGEPVVNTPEEAVVDFYRMGLDTLVLGDYVLRK